MPEATNGDERTEGSEPTPPPPPQEALVIDLSLTGPQLGAGMAMAGSEGDEAFNK